MKKFLSRICTVALVGGALAGLAYAGSAVVQKNKVAKVPAKAEAEVIYEYDFATPTWTNTKNLWNVTNGAASYVSRNTVYGAEFDYYAATTTQSYVEKKTTISFTGGETYTFELDARSTKANAEMQFRLGANSIVMTTPSALVDTETITGDSSVQHIKFTWSPASDCAMYFRIVIGNVEGVTDVFFNNLKITKGGEEPAEPVILDVPYTSNYAEGLDGYTIINANEDTNWNGDPNTWNAYGDAVKCAYNGSLDMDDWFITPGFNLEAGKKYALDFKAWEEGTYGGEELEVFVGNAATVAGMTTKLIDKYNLEYYLESNPAELEAVFTPEEDGVYFFGFHGCTPADRYNLFIGNFTLDLWKEKPYPAAVNGLTVANSEEETPKATVSFNAPTLNAGGTELTSLTKIEVYRGEEYMPASELVKTFENPAPGAKLSFEDQLADPGRYFYKVICFNEDGQSNEYKSDATYLGAVTPYNVNNLEAHTTDNPREILLQWTPVSKTNSYDPLAQPELVTYKLYTVNYVNRSYEIDELIAEDVEGHEYTYTITSDEQKSLRFGIVACYKGKESNLTGTDNPVTVGAPYVDFDEDFTQEGKYYWSVEARSGSTYDFNYSENGGYLQIDSDYDYYDVSVTSGMISLEDTEYPGFSFTVEGTEKGYIYAQVKTPEMSGYENVGTYTFSELESRHGAPVDVVLDLSPYKGQVVSVKLMVYVGEEYVDQADRTGVKFTNFKVVEQTAYDLRAGAISCEDAVPGQDFKVEVTVYNDGVAAAENFTVALYENVDPEMGEPVDSTVVDYLAPGESTVVTFTRNMSKLELYGLAYCAKVNFDADQKPWNNMTEWAESAALHNTFAPASELTVTEADGAAQLSWTAAEEVEAPVVAPEPVTVDFEDGESWSKSYKDWTFYNLDNLTTANAWGWPIPWTVASGIASEVYLYDDSTAKATRPNNTHSGDKCLMADFSYTSGSLNDWFVSPELYGEAQTIKFFAKSTSSGQYHDDITVYYSVDGKEVADFSHNAMATTTLSTSYTEYTVELPAGAKYFAINRTSNGGTVFIDDVTFTPAATAMKAPRREATYGGELLGYNVYCNNELIAENVKGTSYTHSDVTIGNSYTYHVTANYEQGESAPTEPFMFIFTGIQNIFNDANGAEAIFNLNGVRMNADRLAPGVYIVVKDGKSQKVFVK